MSAGAVEETVVFVIIIVLLLLVDVVMSSLDGFLNDMPVTL